MCARTGWPWDYTSECVTMDMVDGLFDHWHDEPPVDVLVASFLGYKPPKRTSERKSRKTNNENIEKLFQMFPSGKIAGPGAPG